MRVWIVAIAVAGSLIAQSGPVCHKGHSDPEYKMTPMPAPPLRTGIGTSDLKITTKSELAQKYFSQGVALLHCFWDFEAYRSFKEAARLDPDAAMAYWGIVQSIGEYKAMESEKKDALEKAKTLMPKASDHEQFYIRAQQKAQDEEKGNDESLREMEALVDKYPDDIDAKLFLSLAAPGGYETDGRPRKNGLYQQAILRDILAEHPESAAAQHYWIHAVEASTHAQDAKHAADVLGKLAPASGHMVHMPGHIYYRLGEWDRARESFLASKKVDEEYMQREGVTTLDDWNYPHNLSYLISSDTESGHYREALELATKLDGLPVNPFLGAGHPTHALTIGGSRTSPTALRELASDDRQSY
jgi:tetratricopeptide (TPR) repeat protein